MSEVCDPASLTCLRLWLQLFDFSLGTKSHIPVVFNNLRDLPPWQSVSRESHNAMNRQLEPGAALLGRHVPYLYVRKRQGDTNCLYLRRLDHVPSHPEEAQDQEYGNRPDI